MRKSAILKCLSPFFILALFILVRTILLTTRKKIKNKTEFLNIKNSNGSIIYSWHNRVLTNCFFIPRFIRKKMVVIASRSNGGQAIAKFLKFLGISSIHGSSNKKKIKDKGGATVLKQSIRLAKKNKVIGFTCDGPRGPRYQLQKGVAFVAKTAKVRAFAISCNFNSYWELKTWDKFQIPKPFSKVEFIVKEAQSLNYENTINQIIKVLEDNLKHITIDKNA